MRLADLAANFGPAIADIYKYEGGYKKEATDSGDFYKGKLIGTNLGITPNAYKAYYNSEPSEIIIKGLTKTKASPIYKKNYWDKIRGDEIANDSVANLMLDVVVNSGVGMISSFKKLMNDTAGKKIVAVTSTPFTSPEIKLLNALPADIYFKNLKTFRERFYKALVQKKPSNQVYLKGWLKRLNSHVYSGAITSHLKRNILIGVGVAALVGGGIYLYKRHKRI